MERETLGAYELKRLLGRGGMGAVYLARDPRLGREVALKVLSSELARDGAFRERFLAEARSSSALSHPNITTIHEIGRDGDAHFIAFEYLEGETLESVLENGPLPPEKVLEIALPLASALAYAHSRGIVHRDLKPANVLLTSLGIPKILDFGLAKILDGAVDPESPTLLRLTQVGMVVGTISYMAPEQALGESVDGRSDVFALGCLLHEMLTGRRPFEGSTVTRVLDRLLHAEPASVSSVRPEVPPELARVVSKALRKKPDERYQSMGELGADLRHVARVSGEGVSISRRGAFEFASAASSTSPGPTISARRRFPAWAAAAVAVALGISATLFFSGGTPQRAGPIAVLYFDNLSDPDDKEKLGRMLAELVTSELSTSETVPVVSRQRLHDVARARGITDTEVDREVATQVARAAGVETMIVGQVAAAGGRILATTELVDVASGRALASERADATSSDDVFVLASSLGDQIRRRLAGIDSETWERAPPGTDSPGEPTASVDAYRHFVDGEMALHAADMEAAADAFEHAVAIDPEFALAQFRLSMVARWLSDGPRAHQAARRAVGTLDGAPAHLRDVVRANALYQDGAYSQAIPLLEGALAREPEQKESLYILGQIYVHSLRDGDTRRAIELMERLLSVDPSFHQVYDRLALSYAFTGDAARARELLAEWEPSFPEKTAGLRSILATFEGQPEEALGFGQAFSWMEGPLFQAAAAMMAGRWDVARRLVEQDPDEWRADHLRAWALRNRAVFHTYVGELDRAADLYRQAGSASGDRTHEGGSGGVPASALQLLAELLYASGEVGAARAEADRALAIQPESWRGLYYAGRLAALDADLEAARVHHGRLSALPAVRTSESAKLYELALRAEIALADGDAARAAGLFRELVRRPLMLDWASTCSSAGAAFRDGLARSLLALGRMDEAISVLESLVTSGPERVDHPVLYLEAHYRLGVLHQEQGRTEAARRSLSRFLERWGGADWEIDIVEDARERLSSLD